MFLPEGKSGKGEKSLRIKGYFEFSYKLKDGEWHICDLDENPVKPAPAEVQEKINSYVNSPRSKEEIKELPPISVITVVLDGEKYIRETIESVLSQTAHT
ncbi:MAG: hypothetical protein RML10_10685 [Geminocystis sp.]|nr:hypothetical protein [Geminocystis sp.]